jgi:hypothetical protein
VKQPGGFRLPARRNVARRPLLKLEHRSNLAPSVTSPRAASRA